MHMWRKPCLTDLMSLSGRAYCIPDLKNYVTATGPFPVLDTKFGAGTGVLGPKEGSDTVILISKKVQIAVILHTI